MVFNKLLYNLTNQAKSEVTKLDKSIKIFIVVKAKRQLRTAQELHRAECWAIKWQRKVLKEKKNESDKTADTNDQRDGKLSIQGKLCTGILQTSKERVEGKGGELWISIETE